VRDVPLSLSRAAFIRSLQMQPGNPATVIATLPVNAALFGQRLLPFSSTLHPTPKGAKLVSQALDAPGPGWARVDGEAHVEPTPGGSRVRYQFNVRVHIRLPEPERWGGQALLSMIEYTAKTVLERVTASFPDALRAAALAVAGEARSTAAD
jgi:hypothetical protein